MTSHCFETHLFVDWSQHHKMVSTLVWQVAGTHGQTVDIPAAPHMEQKGKVQFPQPTWVVLHPLRLLKKNETDGHISIINSLARVFLPPSLPQASLGSPSIFAWAAFQYLLGFNEEIRKWGLAQANWCTYHVRADPYFRLFQETQPSVQDLSTEKGHQVSFVNFKATQTSQEVICNQKWGHSSEAHRCPSTLWLSWIPRLTAYSQAIAVE